MYSEYLIEGYLQHKFSLGKSAVLRHPLHITYAILSQESYLLESNITRLETSRLSQPEEKKYG